MAIAIISPTTGTSTKMHWVKTDQIACLHLDV